MSETSDVTDPAAVVQRHLDAVRAGDAEAMAADYAEDAVLVRGADRYEGRAAIRDYFAGVPARMAGAEIRTEPLVADGDTVRIIWRLAGGPGDGTSGTDTCTVRDGFIVEQHVQLDAADF